MNAFCTARISQLFLQYSNLYTGAAGRRRSAACNGMPVAAAAAAVADTGWLVNAHARVGILVVSDRRFLTKDCQLVQLASLRAYAQIHGYAFHLLQPNETQLRRPRVQWVEDPRWLDVLRRTSLRPARATHSACTSRAGAHCVVADDGFKK